jgi:hypothetical protein
VRYEYQDAPGGLPLEEALIRRLAI